MIQKYENLYCRVIIEGWNCYIAKKICTDSSKSKFYSFRDHSYTRRIRIRIFRWILAVFIFILVSFPVLLVRSKVLLNVVLGI